MTGIRRRAAVAGVAPLIYLVAWWTTPACSAAARLDAVRDRGQLTCGIDAGVKGFAEIDAAGQARGFDVDICRAVATAMLGDPDRVRFIKAASVSQLETTLELDLVVRRLSWTLVREASAGLLFGPIVFFDGQGFLTLKSSAIANATDLRNKRICVDPGEDWAKNLRRYGADHQLNIETVITLGPADSGKRLAGGDCDVYSADKSMLGSVRAGLEHADQYRILDDQISKEPLAPLLRQGDDRFFLIVQWTIFAMIEAEELGVTSQNADAMLTSPDPGIALLLGRVPGTGHVLGLDDRWAYRVVKAVGNYGEMFDRDIGVHSAIKLKRGINSLWTDGGLLYAPPLR